MDERNFELLSRLVETPGLPGREQPVADLIMSYMPHNSWKVSRDAIGNLIARKPGKGPRIMLIVHMDEVGLIVRRINPDGFLQVERMGGISLQALPGASLDLWSENGSKIVHAGVPAEHLVHGNESVIELEALYIDASIGSQKKAQETGIRVGDGLTWHSPLRKAGLDRVTGKALDNRAGCYAMIRMADLLADLDLEYDLFLAFICQEECMVLEAAPVVRSIAPEIIIGLDGTLTFDTPDINEPQCDIRLGGGPCLKIMDVIRGKTAYLPDWQLTQKIRGFMDAQDISYQSEVVVGLSTAVSMMPFMQQGIKTASISLPIRYHHSPVETIDLKDLDATINLLFRLLTESVLVL